MSFFYLSAVKGDITLHLIEKILLNRLEHLKKILKGDAVIYNEYMIEGSVHDNIGHFMLCVIAILGENIEFSQLVLKAEVELFKLRISALATYEICSFAKKLLRSIKKCDNVPFFIYPLTILCQHLLLRDLAKHISSAHNNECEKYTIKLNFRHCLNYVAKRKVEIKNGLAYIPCSKWKQYLTILFSHNLIHRLQKTDLATVKSDSRVMELTMKIKREFFPQIVKTASGLLSNQVDMKSKFFPPCMLNLHLTLRKKHRLSHSQRFYYSLFLKDIGMPVEEAIDFWKGEYRQIPSGHATCSHNWERDEKKYLYGIRHMYGLEGCRKNYTSVNCKRIQSVENACSEGGCPFKSFDSSKLLPLLKDPSELLLSQIEELRKSNRHTKLCLLYLHGFDKNVDGGCDNFSFNFTPVKYYATAAKQENR